MAINYNPYMNNAYMQEMQTLKDRIDKQIQQYQNQNQYMQQQQQPQIQQTFQLSNPNQNISDFDGKYVNNIDDVKNTLVFKNSLFLNKDMNKMWFKDTNGTIRTFNLEEEIQVDENIAEINSLKKEINDLKSLLAQQVQTQNIQPVVEEKQVVAKIEPATRVARKSK